MFDFVLAQNFEFLAFVAQKFVFAYSGIFYLQFLIFETRQGDLGAVELISETSGSNPTRLFSSS